MDINDLISTLTEGLPADQAAVVKAAIERDAVKAKAAGWKQQQEFDAIQQRAQQLQAALEGDAASGRLGAKAYQEWYEKNFAQVQELQKKTQAYEAKYGAIDPNNPSQATPPAGTVTLTPDEVKRIAAAAADERIQGNYAPRWSELLEGTGNLVQKHMFAGRKTPIDFKAVSKLAQEKYQGNLDLAYDEWDKPERDKQSAAAQEAEITRRVNEELQKRGANSNFPAAADMTPGSLSSRSKDVVDKFDKGSLVRELAGSWNTQTQ